MRARQRRQQRGDETINHGRPVHHPQPTFIDCEDGLAIQPRPHSGDIEEAVVGCFTEEVAVQVDEARDPGAAGSRRCSEEAGELELGGIAEHSRRQARARRANRHPGNRVEVQLSALCAAVVQQRDRINTCIPAHDEHLRLGLGQRRLGSDLKLTARAVRGEGQRRPTRNRVAQRRRRAGAIDDEGAQARVGHEHDRLQPRADARRVDLRDREARDRADRRLGVDQRAPRKRGEAQPAQRVGLRICAEAFGRAAPTLLTPLVL